MTISMHTIRASIGVAGGNSVSLKSARLSLDESWSPYVQGELVLPIGDSDFLAALDPREDVRAQITLVQTFGDSGPLSELTARYAGSVKAITAAFTGSVTALSADGFTPWNSFGRRNSTTRSFDLGVRRRAIRYGSADVELPIASDEALLQDYALVATESLRTGILSVRELVGFVLAKIGRHLEPGTADAAVAPEASVWNPGTFGWAFLAPIVQASALRLWCDELRRWHLTGDEEAPDLGALVLSSEGTITDASNVIDRDGDWCDAVVITYRWKDALGIDQVAYDTAETDGFSKVKTIDFTNTPYPGPGAASRVLARSQGRGQVFEVEAVSDYSATPGQPVSVNIAGALAQAGYVGSVSWAWPADEMRVTTRGLFEIPNDAWLYMPDSIRWNDLPADTTWNTLDPKGMV
ncbi:hypothetical protein [Plantibacter sp. YIM 135249]|uniref:hypothetical protein n=1 Tax=Plantibacter sp. YIM 135249 TaxID=3423918 RepID=UPI003D357EB8